MKLDQIIPDEAVRQKVYVAFGAIGLLLGVTQTVVASINVEQPTWLTTAFAVYAYLAAAGFSVSVANTGTEAKAAVITEEPPFVEQVPTAGSDPAQIPDAEDPAAHAKYGA